MKQILSLLFLALFGTALAAQPNNAEAMRVLDRCASVLQRAGAVQTDFVITHFLGAKEQGRMSGLYYKKGNKYHMTSSQTKVWFDGKTQYTYSASTNEVSITQPDKTEQQRSNPYSFINLYKKGYQGSVENEMLRGHTCYTVHLKATGKEPIKEMYVSIDPKSYLPLCVRFLQGGNWVRISLNNLKTHQNFKSGLFEFPAKEFTSAEVVDLR